MKLPPGQENTKKLPLTSGAFIKRILKENDIRFKKKYGQNFLTSSRSLKKIAGAIGTDDLAIEVGSGFGVLTQELATRFKKVIALEIDKEIFPVLKNNLSHLSNIEFYNEDALNFNEEKLPNSYVVCGNIPYNISSPLVRKFLIETKRKPKKIVFLVQKEFAEKIISKKNSFLKMSLEVVGKSRIRGEVGKNNFFPVPRVDSVILEITPRSKPKIPSGQINDFIDFLGKAFGERRKKLVNNLHKNLSLEKEKTIGMLKKMNINERSRAEELELQNWIDIFLNLSVMSVFVFSQQFHSFF